MALPEIRVDCNSEEQILGQIKNAWLNFVKDTENIPPGSPLYTQERDKMAISIRSAIPPDCYNQFVILPASNDPFRRSKIDIAVDEALFEASSQFTNHAEVRELIRSKPYWTEFVKSKE